MKKPKILLVEDSEVQAETTRQLLERNGYEVLLSANGISALKAAKTLHIDVILLDVVLPDINGNEVSRILKFSEDTKGIPIIMVTAKASLDDRISSIDAGADDYLAKPYNEVELISRIYGALKNKALRDELLRQKRQVEDLLGRVGIMAITDPLTGIFNRRHLESELEKEFSKRKRFKHAIACIMLDVDHFKRINDSYGHKGGDKVLKELAQRLKQALRQVDTVARWGGEEFVIVMPQVDREQALKSAARIQGIIADTKFESLNEHLTVSIGISIVSDSIDTAEDLIDAADRAMYQAKKNGRNRIEIAEE